MNDDTLRRIKECHNRILDTQAKLSELLQQAASDFGLEGTAALLSSFLKLMRKAGHFRGDWDEQFYQDAEAAFDRQMALGVAQAQQTPEFQDAMKKRAQRAKLRTVPDA